MKIRRLCIALFCVTSLKVSFAQQHQPDKAPPDPTPLIRKCLLSLCTALDMFELDTGFYPTEAQGLTSLLKNPSVAGWQGPYIKLAPDQWYAAHMRINADGLLVDTWGTPFRYRLIKRNYKVDSAGADGKFDTDDDITPEVKKPSNVGT